MMMIVVMIMIIIFHIHTCLKVSISDKCKAQKFRSAFSH